jgi:hypothetical protein
MRGTPVERLRGPSGFPSAVGGSIPGGADCVYVIGMHRSGTSATAEVLGELGLGLPPAEELIPATRTNERGHFESKTLVRLNERLLASVGGTWSAPPCLEPGWEMAGSLDELRNEASSSFAAAFPRRPAAWKDPRNCIVLPFWQTVLGPHSAAVFVYRDPLEVARSLLSRDDIPITQGLALWERYVRAACANLHGLPTLCTDFRRVLEDPAAWYREAATFLTDTGLAVDTGRSGPSRTSVDAGLRHQRDAIQSANGLGDSQRAILETLRSMDGPHFPWRSPDLGTEPDWVSDVMAMSLQVDRLGQSHRSLTGSRAYRLASSLAKLPGRKT